MCSKTLMTNIFLGSINFVFLRANDSPVEAATETVVNEFETKSGNYLSGFAGFSDTFQGLLKFYPSLQRRFL